MQQSTHTTINWMIPLAMVAFASLIIGCFAVSGYLSFQDGSIPLSALEKDPDSDSDSSGGANTTIKTLEASADGTSISADDSGKTIILDIPTNGEGFGFKLPGAQIGLSYTFILGTDTFDSGLTQTGNDLTEARKNQSLNDIKNNWIEANQGDSFWGNVSLTRLNIVDQDDTALRLTHTSLNYVRTIDEVSLNTAINDGGFRFIRLSRDRQKTGGKQGDKIVITCTANKKWYVQAMLTTQLGADFDTGGFAGKFIEQEKALSETNNDNQDFIQTLSDDMKKIKKTYSTIGDTKKIIQSFF